MRFNLNIDHVATVREARGVRYPDPLEAARIAEDAGATGITVHLRGDRRHIQDRDVGALREVVRGKLNLEMAASDEMVRIALEHRPHQVSLVPERPEEITTEGGLDLTRTRDAVVAAAERLAGAGIGVSLFLDPAEHQVELARGLVASGIQGFEINTDAYTKAWLAAGDPTDDVAVASELAKVVLTATQGAPDLAVYAGHGLTTQSVVPIAGIREIEEFNIGHFLVARAMMVGLDAAVREMLAAIRQGAAS